VMGQQVEIVAIYRRHRRYRAFSGPTATRGCSCWMPMAMNVVLVVVLVVVIGLSIP